MSITETNEPRRLIVTLGERLAPASYEIEGQKVLAYPNGEQAVPPQRYVIPASKEDVDAILGAGQTSQLAIIADLTARIERQRAESEGAAATAKADADARENTLREALNEANAKAAAALGALKAEAEAAISEQGEQLRLMSERAVKAERNLRAIAEADALYSKTVGPLFEGPVA